MQAMFQPGEWAVVNEHVDGCVLEVSEGDGGVPIYLLTGSDRWYSESELTPLTLVINRVERAAAERHGSQGRWLYWCEGPHRIHVPGEAGLRFTNDHAVILRIDLKRHYGRATRLLESWKCPGAIDGNYSA